jgi:hypothetical protein
MAAEDPTRPAAAASSEAPRLRAVADSSGAVIRACTSSSRLVAMVHLDIFLGPAFDFIARARRD